MLVKMLTARAAHYHTLQEGEIVDVPTREAVEMIRSGHAVPVREDGTETALPDTRNRERAIRAIDERRMRKK